jgi:hypothetical protein
MSEQPESNLGPGDVVFAIVLIVAAALVGFAHLFFVGFACSGDTSECAQSSKKNGVYEGTLSYPDGRLYRSAEFEVAFASRKNESDLTFETDAQGHYCIRWANERTYPTATTPAGEPLAGSGTGGPSLGPWDELSFFGAPTDCEEGSGGVPWNRADDAESTWQSRLLILLPLASIAAMIAALLGRRSRYALRLFVAGGTLFAADLLAFVVLWFV